jgi:hypothetical protein
VIAITNCSDLSSSILPSAAVLSKLIHDNAFRMNSSYRYHLYAFLNEEAVDGQCETMLQRIGFTTLRKSIPINISMINHSFYQSVLPIHGCCGAAEFIKLWTYTLIKHRAVVYLDLDVMILKPLDDILDVLLLTPNQRIHQYQRLKLLRDTPDSSNSSFDALITRDYSQIALQNNLQNYNAIPIQGGFWVVKPNMKVFRTLCATVQNLEYTYTEENAWGGIMNSRFWGMPQIQGLLAYYYNYLAPHTALELHNCYFNTILSISKYNGSCIDGMKVCEDCRATPMEEVHVAHPIFCQKPWQCIRWQNPNLMRTIPCRYYMKLWTSTRLSLENHWEKERHWEPAANTGDLLPDIYNGYCFKNRSFVPMRLHPRSLLYKS